MKIDDIVRVLARGDLVVMRSDTIYGIFASALNEQAVKKLHAVRERNLKQGFITLVDSVETAARLVRLDDELRQRLDTIWRADSATSVILPADELKETWLADTREAQPTICLRVPNDKSLRELLAKTGPLSAPSANPPDQPPADNVAAARAYFGEAVSLYVDGGGCDNTLPSRIIMFDDNYQIKTVRSDGRPHPEDFVIKRRRKLYKFARFNEYPTCFHLKEWIEFLKCHPEILPPYHPEIPPPCHPEALAEGSPRFFANAQNDKLSELVVEIGAGSALFAVELARCHPEKLLIAVDIKGDRLFQGAREAAKLNLENIYFVRSDIAQITEVIPPHFASEIWLTFPDPWPRKPDARHRLTAPRYLADYRQILTTSLAGSDPAKSESAKLHLKTDNLPLFEWSLEQLEQNGWKIDNLSRDLHTSDLPKEFKIMTSYEQKFVDDGLPIYYLGAQ
ncbi:tRNA (guanosine(46)-N7)-methyltransferase TrmB [Candidatus Saccharibacteria bacterium]|nr:tRNA (guanosine(46)-N7)-methyltransferase TrmB [Candidatus Saccharibacteria bacterium]